MYLVVGLGNPGPRYQDHRHNAGFMVLEAVARRAETAITSNKFDGLFTRITVKGQAAGLLLPQTYMNCSGEVVAPAARFFKVPPEKILVVHDELDLPFGTLRLKEGGGLAGHNGLRSIADCLGTRDFLRMRFGVGRPLPPMDVTGHVLSAFSPEEQEKLDDHLRRAAKAVNLVLTQGLKVAMGRFHVRPKPKKKKKDPAETPESDGSGAPEEESPPEGS